MVSSSSRTPNVSCFVTKMHSLTSDSYVQNDEIHHRTLTKGHFLMHSEFFLRSQAKWSEQKE